MSDRRFIDVPSNDNMIVPGGTAMDTALRPQAATNFPLPEADLDSLGFRRQQTTGVLHHIKMKDDDARGD